MGGKRFGALCGFLAKRKGLLLLPLVIAVFVLPGLELRSGQTLPVLITDDPCPPPVNLGDIVLPEVLWAEAWGHGTWVTEVQFTTLAANENVYVRYYSKGGAQRGPFLLYKSAVAQESRKFTNIVSTLQGIDPSFNYYGSSGHRRRKAPSPISWSRRGSAAATSQGQLGHQEQRGNRRGGSPILVQNMESTADYRSAVVCFNPTAYTANVEFRILDAAGNLIGSAFTRTLAAYGFVNFWIFPQAGVPFPGTPYDNACLLITVTSGSGAVIAYGCTSNNITNDPAAHPIASAKTSGSTTPTSPESLKVLPEGIWMAASGGGIWLTDVQITDMTGGSTVRCYFDYNGGNRRDCGVIWTGSGAMTSVKYVNMLQTLQAIDPAFTYYGKVGALVFQTQDTAHKIHVSARIMEGQNSKIDPGLNVVAPASQKFMYVQDLTNDASYRSSVLVYNPVASTTTANFWLVDGSGATIGTSFSKTFVGNDFRSFNPFAEAGVAAGVFDNITLRFNSGPVYFLLGYGSTVDNGSNDPSCHALQRLDY
jgi:hypothetical protein